MAKRASIDAGSDTNGSAPKKNRDVYFDEDEANLDTSSLVPILSVVAHRKGERDEMEDAALSQYYARRRLAETQNAAQAATPHDLSPLGCLSENGCITDVD